MLGAIFGDIAGSVYEFQNTNDYNFRMLSKYSRPTDDSFMTLAVAKALMETYGKDDDTIRSAVVRNMQEIGRKYPHGGYGGRFMVWLTEEDPRPYNSFGNGSGMRVSPAGWLYRTLDETLHAAELTAEVTHNHPEGIKGAQAIAAGIFLARAGATKEDIINYIANKFEYNLFRTLEEIKPDYEFYEICQRSVPEAIIAFYEGKDYEDVIRLAISLGGDSDTIACMAGSIAEAFYGMPDGFKDEALSRLPGDLRKTVYDFRNFYHEHSGKPHDGWQEEINKVIIPDDPFMKDNPRIEEMIDMFYQDQNNEQAINNIFNAILFAMSRDGHILIPVEMPEAALKVFDPDKIKVGDTIQSEEELHWKLIHLTNDEGKISMPVFTSQEKMTEGGAGGCSTISFFMDEYFKQVLEMEDVEGIVLNPGEKSLFLNKEIIGELLRVHQESKADKKLN